MRREGYEFSVSPPTVLYRMDKGKKLEPIEELHMEVEDEHTGPIIEAVSLRRGELIEMIPLSVSFFKEEVTLHLKKERKHET